MADTSLTVNGITFVFNQSDIDNIQETIEARAETSEIGGDAPMGNYNYDYDGTLKTITISGALTTAPTTRVAGYTITSILAQKQWLESMINGRQTDITLVDDFAGQSCLSYIGATAPYQASFTTTKCMNARVTFTRQRGNPNMLPFNITLQVGKTV